MSQPLVKRVFLALVALAAAASAPAAGVRETYEASVVGLRVTYQTWDEDRPWAKRNPEVRDAFGVLLEGRQVLTTAQMVTNATLIRLEAFGRPTPAAVRVAYVDAEADLALLAFDPPVEGLRPATMASETPTSGMLSTVRWSNGQLEVAASRIKRFEVRDSYYGRLEHLNLLVETDVAAGGWSEPVFAGERVVGLTANQDERQGRVIPVEILSSFVARAHSGVAPGSYPVLGITWQANEDPAAAAHLGLDGPPRGVLVLQVPWGSSGCGVLKPRDILLSLGGHEIDSSGYYTDARLGHLSLTGIVMDGHAAGDTIPAEVLRNGQRRRLDLTLRPGPTLQDLIPYRRGGEPPPYFVAGGLVFRELDGEYLRSWGQDWVARAPVLLVALYQRQNEAQTPERRRIIIVSSVLPAEYNVGYQGLRDVPVERVNGAPVDSIADVAAAFAQPEGRFHTVTLAPNPTRREIVLDAEGFASWTAEILKRYDVPAQSRPAALAPPDPGPPCPGDY